MKITKKQIAVEYDCMMSVKGPYTEGSEKIKTAINNACEPYQSECTFEDGTKKTLAFIAETRKDIIDRAYDLLNEQKNPAAAALGKLGGSVKSDKKSKSSAANGKLGGRPRKTPASE